MGLGELVDYLIFVYLGTWLGYLLVSQPLCKIKVSHLLSQLVNESVCPSVRTCLALHPLCQ